MRIETTNLKMLVFLILFFYLFLAGCVHNSGSTGGVVGVEGIIENENVENEKEELNIFNSFEEVNIDYDTTSLVLNTGSMEPVLYGGDILLIKFYNSKKDVLKINDIIVYVSDNGNVVHKITNIDGKNIITKGVNNQYHDFFVTNIYKIVGTVVGVVRK